MKQQQNPVDRFIAHVESAPIADLLLKIISLEGSTGITGIEEVLLFSWSRLCIS